MTKASFNVLFIVGIVTSLASCSSTEFSEKSKAKSKSETEKKQLDHDDAVVAKNPLDKDGPQEPKASDEDQKKCEQNSTTTAKLLTESINLSDPTKSVTLHYRLSIDNYCGEEGLALDNKQILFDIDALWNLSAKVDISVIPYEIIIEEKSFKGTLEAVKGSDLFNKQGPNFFHSKTNAIETGLKAFQADVKFTIPASIQPLENRNILKTYLRIGDTKATEVSVPISY